MIFFPLYLRLHHKLYEGQVELSQCCGVGLHHGMPKPQIAQTVL